MHETASSNPDTSSNPITDSRLDYLKPQSPAIVDMVVADGNQTKVEAEGSTLEMISREELQQRVRDFADYYDFDATRMEHNWLQRIAAEMPTTGGAVSFDIKDNIRMQGSSQIEEELRLRTVFNGIVNMINTRPQYRLTGVLELSRFSASHISNSNEMNVIFTVQAHLTQPEAASVAADASESDTSVSSESSVAGMSAPVIDEQPEKIFDRTDRSLGFAGADGIHVTPGYQTEATNTNEQKREESQPYVERTPEQVIEALKIATTISEMKRAAQQGLNAGIKSVLQPDGESSINLENFIISCENLEDSLSDPIDIVNLVNDLAVIRSSYELRAKARVFAREILKNNDLTVTQIDEMLQSLDKATFSERQRSELAIIRLTLRQLRDNKSKEVTKIIPELQGGNEISSDELESLTKEPSLDRLLRRLEVLETRGIRVGNVSAGQLANAIKIFRDVPQAALDATYIDIGLERHLGKFVGNQDLHLVILHLVAEEWKTTRPSYTLQLSQDTATRYYGKYPAERPKI